MSKVKPLLPVTLGSARIPYARGVHLVRGNPLFVNNGLGLSGLPLRFLFVYRHLRTRLGMGK